MKSLASITLIPRKWPTTRRNPPQLRRRDTNNCTKIASKYKLICRESSWSEPIPRSRKLGRPVNKILKSSDKKRTWRAMSKLKKSQLSRSR